MGKGLKFAYNETGQMFRTCQNWPKVYSNITDLQPLISFLLFSN